MSAKTLSLDELCRPSEHPKRTIRYDIQLGLVSRPVGEARAARYTGEEGKNRERLGETIKRLSFQKLLEVTNIKAQAQHVQEPRHNPYIFFKEEEVPGGWDRDLEAYRKRHLR